jgi:hypothetical protein
LTLAIVALCIAGLVIMQWQRQRAERTNAALFARLPSDNAVQFFLDVQALRQAGLLDLLAGSRAAEETDYRRFVESTQFDYREDLDAILASRQKSGDLYCLLRGRFQWEQLRSYARSAGGTCRNAFCSVQTERPERYVSFFAVLPDVLALAISSDPNGAYGLSDRSANRPSEEELRHPVWINFPSGVLTPSESLPAGSRILVSAVQKADRVTLALDSAEQGFQAILRARCKTESEADEIAAHLQQMTEMLRKFLVRDKQTPNPKDLSGVLTSGTFRRQNTTVLGHWPIQRVFLESLAQGSL